MRRSNGGGESGSASMLRLWTKPRLPEHRRNRTTGGGFLRSDFHAALQTALPIPGHRPCSPQGPPGPPACCGPKTGEALSPHHSPRPQRGVRAPPVPGRLGGTGCWGILCRGRVGGRQGLPSLPCLPGAAAGDRGRGVGAFRTQPGLWPPSWLCCADKTTQDLFRGQDRDATFIIII